RPPTSTRFPYTTLFRSSGQESARKTRAGAPGAGARSPGGLEDGCEKVPPGAEGVDEDPARRRRLWEEGRVGQGAAGGDDLASARSEEHTSELQSPDHLV